MNKKGNGILAHISSLPSAFGIGDAGKGAYRFVDFLKATKQKYWQILPLNPTETIYGNSPYSSFSAFACNPLFIDPVQMVQEGWLAAEDLSGAPRFSENKVDYDTVIDFKKALFDKAYGNFCKGKENLKEYEHFCVRNKMWLDDFALFIALKNHFQGALWAKWPKVLLEREPGELARYRRELKDAVDKEKFLQYVIHAQWSNLRAYARKNGIQIIGDIPIYVNYDSADVWAHQELFALDENKEMRFVAGVPPDYFSKTGQRWGNPVYLWEKLKEEKYAWWFDRIRKNLDLFDLFRIDHFRGFVAFWCIDAEEKTAVNGKWVKAPAYDFFKQLVKNFPNLSIIAEDLGIITPDVTKVMMHFHFPGMKVLLFAFSENIKTHPYIPENYPENCVVYTGTHDNNTVKGWLTREAGAKEKENLEEYFKHPVNAEAIHWDFIEAAMNSKAKYSIIALQDILGLGEEARMNTPATTHGNWQWRFCQKDLEGEARKKLLKLTEASGRA